MAMLYVIFIHLMWHKCLFFFDIRHIFLIEMPLFFVITGMAHYFARTSDLQKFFLSKLQRILIPYWGYAIVCMMLHAEIFSLWTTDFVISWLNPFADQISRFRYIAWALWFVPVYLLVSLFIPALKKLFTLLNDTRRSHRLVLVMMPAAVLMSINFIFTVGIEVPDSIQKTCFYAFWVYIGFFYVEFIHPRAMREMLPICLSMSAIGLLLFVCAAYSYEDFTFDMQANKFPPNFVFLAYNLCILPILLLLSKEIDAGLRFLCRFKPWAWIFEQYKRRCYSVFLYHSLAFLLTDALAIFIPIDRLGYSITIVVLSAWLGRLFGRLEDVRLIRI